MGANACKCCHCACCAQPSATDVQVLAGKGPKMAGRKNGAKADATFHTPKGLCRYRDVNNTCLLVADNDSHWIRRVNLVDGKADSNTETFIGADRISHGKPLSGFKNGTALHALLDNPHDICFDENNAIVYFTCRFAVRKFEKDKVTTLCGTAQSALKDGKGNTARFKRPSGLVVTNDGKTLYVCDDNCLRRVETKTGKVTTLIKGQKMQTKGDGNDDADCYDDGDDDDDDDAADADDNASNNSDEKGGHSHKRKRKDSVDFTRPRFVVFDPHTTTLESALYISGPGTLYRYDIEKDELKTYPLKSQHVDPYGLAVMPNGNFLVASNSLASKDQYRTGVFMVDPDSKHCTPIVTNDNEKKNFPDVDCITVTDTAWTGDGSNSYFAAPFGLLRHWDDNAQACFITDANNNAIVQITLRFHPELFDAIATKPGATPLAPVDQRKFYDPYKDTSGSGNGNGHSHGHHHHNTANGTSGANGSSGSANGDSKGDDDDSDGDTETKNQSGNSSNVKTSNAAKRNLRHRLTPSTITRLSANLPVLPPIAAFPAFNCKNRCDPGTCRTCDLQYDRDRELELMIRAWYAFSPAQKAPVVEVRKRDPPDATRCCGYDALTDGQCRYAGNSKCIAVTNRGPLCRNCCAEMHMLLPKALDYCPTHNVQAGGTFATGEQLVYTPPWPALNSPAPSIPATPSLGATAAASNTILGTAVASNNILPITVVPTLGSGYNQQNNGNGTANGYGGGSATTTTVAATTAASGTTTYASQHHHSGSGNGNGNGTGNGSGSGNGTGNGNSNGNANDCGTSGSGSSSSSSTASITADTPLAELTSLDLARIRMKLNLGLNGQYLLVDSVLKNMAQSMENVIDDNSSNCEKAC